ncbi:MAG: hypothetical protein WCC48_10735 [Anaeromyxobacteraceae bacterium]
MAGIGLYGSRGGVGDGVVTLGLGPTGTLPQILEGVLGVTYILGGVYVLAYVVSPFGSFWYLAPVPLLLLLLHGALRLLSRRGDDLNVCFRREPTGHTSTVSYELTHRFKPVLQGAFGPELLRIASYWQQLYPAGGGHVFQLIFRPDPPATMVHERYSEGIPIFESRDPKECLEQAIELLKVLKYDPAEIEARIQEVEVLLPEKAQPAPPPGDAGGGR